MTGHRPVDAFQEGFGDSVDCALEDRGTEDVGISCPMHADLIEDSEVTILASNGAFALSSSESEVTIP